MSKTLPLTLTGAFLLMACYPTYQPGTLVAYTQAGTVRTTGCLDIAVEPSGDPAAAGPAAEIRIGNRCDTGVRVDLARIDATIRLDDGRSATMVIYDPMGEIRPALLDGRSMAREVLEFHPASSRGHGVARQLCLDFRAIDQEDPSPLPVVSCIPLSPNAVSPAVVTGEPPYGEPLYGESPEDGQMADGPVGDDPMADSPAADAPETDVPETDAPAAGDHTGSAWPTEVEK